MVRRYTKRLGCVKSFFKNLLAASAPFRRDAHHRQQLLERVAVFPAEEGLAFFVAFVGSFFGANLHQVELAATLVEDEPIRAVEFATFEGGGQLFEGRVIRFAFWHNR